MRVVSFEVAMMVSIAKRELALRGSVPAISSSALVWPSPSSSPVEERERTEGLGLEVADVFDGSFGLRAVTVKV